ncbi:MAG: AraC family transcriptional regulator [Sphingobacteriales bacterium]|nr:MAG: AraC family transcriptional regulator [Sphingobacteriales bacterium]
MVLHVRNMVCPRCIMAVENILQKLAVPFTKVKMGEVLLHDIMSNELMQDFEIELNKIGFELVTDTKMQLLEQIRIIIREYVEDESDAKVNLSVVLSDKLNYDYTYLSNFFSAETGATIEKFYIAQRIGKVMQLLKQGDASVTDIANKLGYSSAGYLSSQFKKATGVTPGAYKLSLIKAKANL